MVLVVSNRIPVAKGWEEDFERWTESQAFMEAHANTPPKEAFTGPSKLEVHEVIAESPAASSTG